MKNEKLSSDEQFASFDIKDLYPSLAKYNALSEIQNRINEINFATTIEKCALIELTTLSLEFMLFTIDNKQYYQNQVLFIDAPTLQCF